MEISSKVVHWFKLTGPESISLEQIWRGENTISNQEGDGLPRREPGSIKYTLNLPISHHPFVPLLCANRARFTLPRTESYNLSQHLLLSFLLPFSELSWLPFFFLSYMCTYMCGVRVWSHVCMHICVHLGEGQRLSSLPLHFVSWGRVSGWTQTSLILLVLLASLAQGSYGYASWVLELWTGCHSHLAFMWFWESKLPSSCSVSRNHIFFLTAIW